MKKIKYESQNIDNTDIKSVNKSLQIELLDFLLEMGRIPIIGQADELLLATETARLMEISGLNQIEV